MSLKKAIILSIIFLLFFVGCSKKRSEASLSKVELHTLIKPFISITTLESAGFERIAPSHFDFLFKDDTLYILSMLDRNIAKFDGNNLVSFYKANKGQGPRDMLAPKSIFFYGTENIAVHDYEKKSVAFFDDNLGYIREEKVTERLLKIADADCGLVAFTSDNGYVFGFLEDNFNISDSFVRANQDVPFEKFFQSWLNHGFFVSGNLVAHSYRLQPKKNCQVDVYRLDNRKRDVSLEWEQPFVPTQKNIENRKNMYFTIFVAKLNDYFVVQNAQYKNLMSGKRDYEICIFDSSGKLIGKISCPYRIIRMSSKTPHSKFYVMGEDESIYSVDIKDIVN